MCDLAFSKMIYDKIESFQFNLTYSAVVPPNEQRAKLDSFHMSFHGKQWKSYPISGSAECCEGFSFFVGPDKKKTVYPTESCLTVEHVIKRRNERGIIV